MFLKKLKIGQENPCFQVKGFQRLQRCHKKTPTQVFSYEICEIFRSTYFEEYLQTTAFVSIEIEVHFERKRGKTNYYHY